MDAPVVTPVSIEPLSSFVSSEAAGLLLEDEVEVLVVSDKSEISLFPPFNTPINSYSTPSYSPLIVVFPVVESEVTLIEEITPSDFNSFNLPSVASNPSSKRISNISSNLNVGLLCWLLSEAFDDWDELFVVVLV